MSEYVPHVPVSTYVPTTDEVETAFHEFASWLETKYPGEYESAPEFADWLEAMHGFRRWLAALIREAKAEALEEASLAYGSGQLSGIFLGRDGYPKAWLRARAAEYREGSET